MSTTTAATATATATTVTLRTTGCTVGRNAVRVNEGVPEAAAGCTAVSVATRLSVAAGAGNDVVLVRRVGVGSLRHLGARRVVMNGFVVLVVVATAATSTTAAETVATTATAATATGVSDILIVESPRLRELLTMHRGALLVKRRRPSLAQPTIFMMRIRTTVLRRVADERGPSLLLGAVEAVHQQGDDACHEGGSQTDEDVANRVVVPGGGGRVAAVVVALGVVVLAVLVL